VPYSRTDFGAGSSHAKRERGKFKERVKGVSGEIKGGRVSNGGRRLRFVRVLIKSGTAGTSDNTVRWIKRREKVFRGGRLGRLTRSDVITH